MVQCLGLVLGRSNSFGLGFIFCNIGSLGFIYNLLTI